MGMRKEVKRVCVYCARRDSEGGRSREAARGRAQGTWADASQGKAWPRASTHRGSRSMRQARGM